MNIDCSGNTNSLISHVLLWSCDIDMQGRQTGGVGGSQPPLNFEWGVEHLSTPLDFEKKFLVGGGVGSP